MLGFEKDQKYRNFDVFVFEYCNANIKACQPDLKLPEAKMICYQLLEGLQQLAESEKCHNDLKPENVLLKKGDFPDDDGNYKYEVKICDFGTTNKSGGTAGWTWPKFRSQRKPGKSDMYSIALLMLYVMCDTKEIFYCIRNNSVEDDEPWLPNFREIPFIKLVMRMMSLELDVKQCRDQWTEISDTVQRISKSYLMETCGVGLTSLELKGEIAK